RRCTDEGDRQTFSASTPALKRLFYWICSNNFRSNSLSRFFTARKPQKRALIRRFRALTSIFRQSSELRNEIKQAKRETMNNQSFRRLISSFALALMLAVFAQAVWADEALTERNKAIVRDFYTTVLIGRNVDAAPRFLRPDYAQGNPGNNVPTGLK